MVYVWGLWFGVCLDASRGRFARVVGAHVLPRPGDEGLCDRVWSSLLGPVDPSFQALLSLRTDGIRSIKILLPAMERVVAPLASEARGERRSPDCSWPEQLLPPEPLLKSDPLFAHPASDPLFVRPGEK